MCGINGIVGVKKIPNIKERINNMNTSIAHRGPDAEGAIVFNEKRLALGHRRLSVVDIDSRSNQPFFDEDGRSVITFNGEIYNFRELRKSLNCTFFTESDTEVLLKGIRTEGVDFVKKCNGMFAFSYYDLKKKQMFLARDRFGIKPLYYYNDGNMFIFSSEIKGILSSGLIEPEFNEDAIDEYLGNRYVREPYTFFKNIYQLPAASYMILTQELDMKIIKYWDLPEKFNVEDDFDEDVIYENFKAELNNAIKRRMMADVPVGAYLSGGVDSGIISAIASQMSDNPLNTYTIGFPEMNEFRFARKVAECYETNHHEITMHEGNYFSMLEEMIKFKDAPLGVPNEIPLAHMSKELKKETTVVLSGEGADELMGGYGRIFRASFDFENVDADCEKSFYDYFIEKYEYVPRSIREKYLRCGYSLRKIYDNQICRDFSNHANEESVFRFFHQYHVRGLLQRVDITTMYAGVEARVPFLDHELVEFSYKHVPFSLKLKWDSDEDRKAAKSSHADKYSEVSDIPKYLIRRYAMELLPEEVVTRKKMGFPVPLNEWLNNIEEMAKSILKDADWLKTEMLDELCDDCRNNSRSGQILWMFINIEIFRKLYFNKQWKY